MDKKNAMRRAKRQSKVLEENFWDCSVCTYRNTAEAFKCLMCDVRKGTSTRKPRLNQALVAQQAGAAGSPSSGGAAVGAGAGERPPSTTSRRRGGRGGGSGRRGGGSGGARHRGVDRSTAQTREVTVNNLTVVITEYKLRRSAPQQDSNEEDEDSERA